MGDWTQPKRLQQRHHSNGRTAEVYLQRDGRFYACELLAPGEVVRSFNFRDNVPTLKLARLLADQNAHPNCDGSCPGWQDDPSAIIDPDCQSVLRLKTPSSPAPSSDGPQHLVNGIRRASGQRRRARGNE